MLGREWTGDLNTGSTTVKNWGRRGVWTLPLSLLRLPSPPLSPMSFHPSLPLSSPLLFSSLPSSSPVPSLFAPCLIRSLELSLLCPFAPLPFRSLELSLPGLFANVFGSEYSWVRKLQGMKVPGARARKFQGAKGPGSERAKERKFQGANWPGSYWLRSELARERKGCESSSPPSSTTTVGLLALSRISPRIRVRVSVSIVVALAPGGYSWI